MKETDTLGLTVMVSPVLWTSDHVGKIGTIEFTDFSEDNIWVKFDDEELDCFSAKTLFVLLPPHELTELAKNEHGYLSPPLPQDHLKLAGLQVTGEEQQLKYAFELVQEDPELHRLATSRLNEVIDLEPRRKIGR